MSISTYFPVKDQSFGISSSHHREHEKKKKEIEREFFLYLFYGRYKVNFYGVENKNGCSGYRLHISMH